MKSLVISFFMISFAIQASAHLNTEPMAPGKDAARIEILTKAWNNADFETYLDTANPDEITQLIQGTVADGRVERISSNRAFNFRHVFLVYLNNNRHGQKMVWLDNGVLRKTMKVSGAGIRGKFTPRGTFAVHNLNRNAFSRKFQSKMPCAFFFSRGGTFAIHGTTHISHLGSPASNGCVRVNPKDICPIFDEISERGEGSSVLVQIQETPSDLNF